MSKTRSFGDKLAIGFSFVCLVHCLFVPSFFILTAGGFAIAIDNEFVHKLILIIAAPISIFSLTLGYKNHKNIYYLAVGFIGLFILTIAIFLAEFFVSELTEKILTLSGSILVAYSHFKNYKLCKALDCHCHNKKSV